MSAKPGTILLPYALDPVEPQLCNVRSQPVTIINPDGSAATGAGATLGTVTVKPVAEATAAVSQIASANADTALLAANANRLPGSSITNDSTAILYVLLGGGVAAATNYSYPLAAKGTVGAVLVLPDGWTGAVRGFWSAANGFAYVTELSA